MRKYSINCFQEALLYGYEEFRKRPADRARNICLYNDCLLSMPPEVKNIMIEGIISPRMFEHLSTTANIESDTFRLSLEDLRYPHYTLVSVDDLYQTFIQYVPEEVTCKGVSISFLYSLSEVAFTVREIMGDQERGRRLPTLTRVRERLEESQVWPAIQQSFFVKGGKVEHVFDAIIQMSKRQSWASGDGSYDEDFRDEEVKLPVVQILDFDFHYVETIVMKYLVDN